jgi:hypothetical protein
MAKAVIYEKIDAADIPYVGFNLNSVRTAHILVPFMAVLTSVYALGSNIDPYPPRTRLSAMCFHVYIDSNVAAMLCFRSGTTRIRSKSPWQGDIPPPAI